jgi:hypothetical protein
VVSHTDGARAVLRKDTRELLLGARFARCGAASALEVSIRSVVIFIVIVVIVVVVIIVVVIFVVVVIVTDVGLATEGKPALATAAAAATAADVMCRGGVLVVAVVVGRGAKQTLARLGSARSNIAAAKTRGETFDA